MPILQLHVSHGMEYNAPIEHSVEGSDLVHPHGRNLEHVGNVVHH